MNTHVTLKLPGAAALSLGQQFQVAWTGFISVETELQRVLEMVEAEIRRAALVRAVEEGAMRDRFRHAVTLANGEDETFTVIGNGLKEPAILW